MARSSLALRHQVGQLFMLGFEGVELAPLQRALLRSLQPGGSVLFRRNIATAEQTHALHAALEAGSRAPLFRCVDVEGGTVDRLRDLLAPIPSAAAVAATGDEKCFERHGALIGEAVRALGFNVSFAPVLDLDLPPARGVLTSRTASSDPRAVAAYAERFLRGMRTAGVLGCGKHFPGLGEAPLDSHKDLPVVRKAFKRLWREDLVPYRALRKELPFVMVAHAAFPEVTDDRTPASLSRFWIEGVLRRRIGFKGLVLTDDLEMGGVLGAVSIEDAAVEALRAGADMLLVCSRLDWAVLAHDAVLREAERDRKFRRRVEKAADRVRRVKERHASLGALAPVPSAATVDGLRDGIERFSREVARRTAEHA